MKITKEEQRFIQALRVEARNVVNTEEIDKYIAILLERAQTDQVKKWLKKTFRKYLINEAPGSSVSVPDSSYPDYINEAINGGQEVYFVGNLESIVIRPVIDYLNTLESINFGYDQAKKKSDVWHEEISNQTKEVTIDDDSVIVKKYKNGYTWRLLQTKEDYVREGDAMGHCVGEYDPGKYTIFSLRSLKNEPRVTIELSIEEPFTVQQVKGSSNKAPIKYRDYVVDFLENYLGEEKLELADHGNDLKRIGIFITNKFVFYPENEFVGINVVDCPISQEHLPLGGLFVSKNIIVSLETALNKNLTVECKQEHHLKNIYIGLFARSYYYKPVGKIESKEHFLGKIVPLQKTQDLFIHYIVEHLLEEAIEDSGIFYIYHNDKLQHIDTIIADKSLIKKSKDLIRRNLIVAKKEGEKRLIGLNSAVKNKYPVYFYMSEYFIRRLISKSKMVHGRTTKYLYDMEEYKDIVTKNRTKIGTLEPPGLRKFLGKLKKQFLKHYMFVVEGKVFVLETLHLLNEPFRLRVALGKEQVDKIDKRFWSNISEGMRISFNRDVKLDVPEIKGDCRIFCRKGSTVKTNSIKVKELEILSENITCNHIEVDSFKIEDPELNSKLQYFESITARAVDINIDVRIDFLKIKTAFFTSSKAEIKKVVGKSVHFNLIHQSNVTVEEADIFNATVDMTDGSLFNNHPDEEKAVNTLKKSDYNLIDSLFVVPRAKI